MRHFFKYPSAQYEPVRYVVNPVRCVQAFLCLGCLALAVYMTVELSLLHVAFKVVLTVTAVSFAAITIVDIIATSHYDPIFWNNWLLFAVGGALCFLLCVGILVATSTGILPVLIIGEIMNGVTGIMFLLDACCFVNASRRKQVAISPYPYQYPYEQRPQYEQRTVAINTDPYNFRSRDDFDQRSVSSRKTASAVSEEEKESVKALPTTASSLMTDETQVSMHETVYEVTTPERVPPLTKRPSTSYGGTFPMGRDATPLPSPEPLYPEEKRPTRIPQSARSKPECRRAPEKITEKESVRSYQGSEPPMQLHDGTILTPVRNEAGEILYKAPDGTLYKKCDCLPLSKDQSKLVRPTDSPMTQIKLSQTPRRLFQSLDGKIQLSDGTIVTPVQTNRGEVYYRSYDGTLYTKQGVPLASAPEGLRQPNSRSGSRFDDMPPCDPRRGDQSLVPLKAKDQGAITAQRSTDAARVIVQESMTKIEKSPTGEIIEQTITRTRSADKGDELLMKSDNLSASSRSMQRSPNQMAANDKILRTVQTVQKSVEQVSKCEPCNSRTVAISTRMVPKGSVGRAQSAPGTPEPIRQEVRERPVRSAEGAQATGYQYKQQQQDAMYASYHPKKCGCGRQHHQSPVAVHGHVTQPGSGFYPQIKCTAQVPCGHRNCSCCRGRGVGQVGSSPRALQPIDESRVLQQPQPAQICATPQQLQTISEGECETDPSSTWEHEVRPDTTTASETSSVTETPQTSSDNVEACPQRCLLCAANNCKIHKSPDTEQVVQTSETRMIRARDLQKMGQNLPGSTDPSR